MKKSLSLLAVSQKQVGTSLSRIYLKELKRGRKRLEEIEPREEGQGGRREGEKQREKGRGKEGSVMSAACLKEIYRPAKNSSGHPVLSPLNTCRKENERPFKEKSQLIFEETLATLIKLFLKALLPK